MTRTISIAVGEFDLESLSGFKRTNSLDERELTSAIRLADSKKTTGGRELVTGEIASETVEEVKELRINEEERTTAKDHILRLNEQDQLELVESERDDPISAETVERIETDQTSFSIIDEEVALLEGIEDSINIINQAQKPKARLVEIEVGELVEELAKHNKLKSTKQATFSDLDVETDRVTISGYNPLENREYANRGKLEYTVATIMYRDQELTCGIHRHNGLIIFGPMNYPTREIADFVMDWILDFVVPFP